MIASHIQAPGLDIPGGKSYLAKRDGHLDRPTLVMNCYIT